MGFQFQYFVAMKNNQLKDSNALESIQSSFNLLYLKP